MPLYEKPQDRIRRLNQTLLSAQARSEKLRNQAAQMNLDRQFRREEQDIRVRETSRRSGLNFKTAERYAATPLEGRQTFKAVRQSQIANDPQLQELLKSVEETGAAYRRSFTPTPSGTLEQANPAAVAAATPVPISQKETFDVRGRAFDPEFTRTLSGTEAAQLADTLGPNRPDLVPIPDRILNRSVGEYLPGRAFERGLETVQGIPYAGETTARQIEFLTSPQGIALGLLSPSLAAQSSAGAAAGGTAGTVAEELGAPKGTAAIGELAGTFAGPIAAPGIRAGGQTIGRNLATAAEREGGIGGLLASETGGTKIPRGNARAQELVNVKEETLLKPGKVTQIPGIKQILSGLNPSVSTERNVVVAANARQAAQSSLETEFQALRQPAVSGIKEVFETNPPKYIGPKDNPFKNTIKDWGDNPEFYQLGPDHLAAAEAYKATSNQTLQTAAGEFNVEIGQFPEKPGGFYVPTVATRDSIDEALQKVSNSYTSSGISGKGPRGKTRLYEGAYQRWQNNPGFKAETDIDNLTAIHDKALANMAGGETFKLGAGGKTKLEVMQETHPELASRMEGLRASLNSLRSTAGRVNEKIANAIDDFLANPDAANLSDLADDLDVRIGVNAVGKMGPNFGKNAAQINDEIRRLRAEIKVLRPAWDNANIEPYILNQKTFRYHQPEESLAIDKILTTKLPVGDSFLSAIDEVRLTAFGADTSPLTIQGGLGLAVDPITGAKSLPGVVGVLFNEGALTKVAQEEADMVRRFTVATGKPFGQVGQEFVQANRGVERVPGLRILNQRMMNAVEYIRYQQWKSNVNLLKKLNPGISDAVADAEAANFLSKVVPALNPTERGVSPLQARLERAPVISTSFIGGPATFLKDAASGLAKLGASTQISPAARWQSLSGREQLAVLRGMELTATISTLTVGSYIASGYSPEEAVKMALDPKSPRFMTLAFGKNFYVPIGGPIRSFARGVAPQEKDGVYIPFAGLPQWVRGKATPPLSRSVELARNKDYQGRKIYTGDFPENVLRGLWYGAEGVLPLSAGEVSEAGRTGETSNLPQRVAGQLLGADIREAGITDRRNQTARDVYGRDWADLTADEQLEIGPEVAADADNVQILSRLRTIPEFDGITNDVRNEIYSFQRDVDAYRGDQVEEWGEADKNWKDSAETVAEQQGRDPAFLEWAIALNSDKTKAENRNQEYIDFLLEHYDEILRARRASDLEGYGPNYKFPNWLRALHGERERVGAR